MYVLVIMDNVVGRGGGTLFYSLAFIGADSDLAMYPYYHDYWITVGPASQKLTQQLSSEIRVDAAHEVCGGHIDLSAPACQRDVNTARL